MSRPRAFVGQGSRKMWCILGCCAGKAVLIVLLDFPPHAAAFMRLVWKLHSRETPGIAVTCVTPLELLDLKQIMTYTPDGKVQVLLPSSLAIHPSCCVASIATWGL